MLNHRGFREVLKKFQVHLLMEWWFRTFPRSRRVRNFTYPIQSLEAWLVDREIFRQGIYSGVFDLGEVRTFADLGCNRGLFSIWLAANCPNRPKGILVEANPYLIPEIQSLLSSNNLKNFYVVHGAVGTGLTSSEVEICIPPTDVGAGLISLNPELSQEKHTKSLKVPALRFSALWDKHFRAGETCDLLKLDIEGAEGRFLDDEVEFLAKVRFLVVEVHERAVSLANFKQKLGRLGFSLVKEKREDSETCLLFAVMNSK